MLQKFVSGEWEYNFKNIYGMYMYIYISVCEYDTSVSVGNSSLKCKVWNVKDCFVFSPTIWYIHIYIIGHYNLSVRITA